jgi:hypothetical protein
MRLPRGPTPTKRSLSSLQAPLPTWGRFVLVGCWRRRARPNSLGLEQGHARPPAWTRTRSTFPTRPGEGGEPPGDTLELSRLGGPFQAPKRRAQRHSRRLTQLELGRRTDRTQLDATGYADATRNANATRHSNATRDAFGDAVLNAIHFDITRSTADYRYKNGRQPDSSSRLIRCARSPTSTPDPLRKLAPDAAPELKGPC